MADYAAINTMEFLQGLSQTSVELLSAYEEHGSYPVAKVTDFLTMLMCMRPDSSLTHIVVQLKRDEDN